MKKLFLIVFLWGGFNALGQATPQLDALLAAQVNPEPTLLEYAPNFELQDLKRREQLQWIKAQLDTLDIPESKRYRIMRDLYRGREAHWLEKYQLSARVGRDSL